MRRTLLILSAVCLYCMALCAEPVSKQKAQQIAAQWIGSKSPTHRAPAATEMKAVVALDAVNGLGHPYLYAVQAPKGKGYVIVSGDDRAPAILGYTLSGTYDESMMPDNMRSWLQYYIDEIEQLESQNLTTTETVATVGEPIAKTTTSLWDQGKPYNAECPMVTTYADAACTTIRREPLQAVTGCAATALAQVLYMWRDEYAKPETKEGKLSKDIPAQKDVYYESAEKENEVKIPVWLKYNDEAIPATTTIDWANLTDVYSQRDEKGKIIPDAVLGTAEQQAAVARLMHICGALSNMNYGTAYTGGSGTDATSPLIGLTNYMNFPNIRMVNQSSQDYQGWVKRLYDEVKTAKAVFFCGSSSSGGHAFVIDGYDKEDLFHVNWGWSGLANEAEDNGGFYRINSLLPTQQGIGGVAVNDGFRLNQSFYTGLYPNAPASTEAPTLAVSMLISQQTDVTVKDEQLKLFVYAFIANATVPTMEAQAGISLENESGYKSIIPIGEGLSNMEIANVQSIEKSLTWTGVKDGDYTIKAYYRTTTDDDAWAVCENSHINYIKVTVSNGKATVRSCGKREVDMVSNNVKSKYFHTDDVSIKLNYKMTKGAFDNVMLSPVAIPVKADANGDFITDETRKECNTQTPTVCSPKEGEAFTVSTTFPASKLEVGYYKILCACIADMISILPGEIYFEVTDKEPFKFIFKGTPYVKYADAEGVIYMGANFYNHKFEKLRAFGYSVASYTGSNGKNYLVDNSPDTLLVVKDTLTADVVLTPNYVLNESDLGDASISPVWEFNNPDSVARFNNFQEKCCFVKPSVFNAVYIDINMSCDATNGWIDNLKSKETGYAEVGSGTKFTLPARYGTIYSMTTKEPLAATTIADSTAASFRKSVDAQGNQVSTLFYNGSDNDSIQIVVGENIKLVSISASYPGGDNTLTWLPDTTATNQTATELITVQKSNGAGGLLYDVTDLTLNGGLQVIAGAHRDSCSVQIEVPNEKDESKYLSVSFQMGEGFSFALKQVLAQMRLEGADKSAKVQMILSDELGNKLESKLYEYNKADTVLLDTLMNVGKPNDIHLEGKITLKMYVYGAADAYRLVMPIDCAGEICEVLRFPEGYTFTPYKAKSEIDLDGVGLLTVDSYEVIGVDDEKKHVILNAIEEVPMGDILIIHSDVAGAVHHIPLTRADDAYVRGNNKLWVSDGTVKGGTDIYRFTKEGDLYVFRNSTADVTLPRGEIYLKYHSGTNQDVYYLSEEDVPALVEILTLHEKEDNNPTIEQHKGRTIKEVVLDGHTFYKNHMWNTLCLPFDIIGNAIETTPLSGAEIWELDLNDKDDYAAPTGFNEESGLVTLNFKPIRSIEPGKPYFLEWKTQTATQIDNPVFKNVTIKTTAANEMTATSSDGKVQIVGTYAPEMLAANGQFNLYVGADDNVYIPNENYEVGAFNAYFLIDLGNGLGKAGTAQIKRIRLNIAEKDIPMRVIEIEVPSSLKNGVWYDLQGRQYTDKPTKTGIYILDGKKILIK